MPAAKHKILVLDATNQNTLAIVRSLGAAGYEIHVAGYQASAPAFFSIYCKRKIRMPSPVRDESGFAKALLQALASENYLLVMPVGFGSYKVCAAIQDKIRERTKLIVTSKENITLASGKDETYALAEQLGIPFPKTFKPASQEELSKLNLQFPVVIKAPFESGKNVVEYARNETELKRKFDSMCRRNNYSAPHLPLLQEYVEGDGYGFFAYYENGICKRIFMHHRIREYPVTGGASVCAESFRDENLKALGKRMLDYLKWDGVAMVEFKKDNRSGEYKLMEINPKFWGSLELAIVAGVDFPGMLVKRAGGFPVEAGEEYSQITFQWMLNGELYHFLERPSSFFRILSTCFRSKKDFRWSDPVPHVLQFLFIFIHYYKKLTGR